MSVSFPTSDEAQVLIIGEVGLAHDGSLGNAHAFVDAIADAGAAAVKFQTHIAAAESTPAEPFRVKFSSEDASRYDYWVRTGFSEPQWAELAAHARERGLHFISSPFSLAAVELLERIEVAFWKVASGEVGNLPMLEAMVSTGRPVVVSSGMSSWAELDLAVECVRRGGVPVAVMQCTTAYPSPPEKIGLNLIGELRQRYDCPAGLSDHSGTIYPCLAAVTLGARILEVHVTLSRRAFGPDVPASVTPEELGALVAGVRMLEVALANPVDKDAMAREMLPMRELFTRSVVAAQALPAGTRLSREDLACKKPGTGIPASRLDQLVGRELARSVEADQLLSEEDLR